MNSRTIILGVIGSDCHFAGHFLLWRSLKDAGFNAISLGACVQQEEFINAAIETKADAILISSLYGMGILDCEGLREKCEEVGLHNILLYAGGILTSGEWKWETVDKKFKEMGFNRVYPPGTLPSTAIADLKKDLRIIDD
jgi:methylaspartate mutase sigma subunit